MRGHGQTSVQAERGPSTQLPFPELRILPTNKQRNYHCFVLHTLSESIPKPHREVTVGVNILLIGEMKLGEVEFLESEFEFMFVSPLKSSPAPCSLASFSLFKEQAEEPWSCEGEREETVQVAHKSHRNGAAVPSADAEEAAPSDWSWVPRVRGW